LGSSYRLDLWKNCPAQEQQTCPPEEAAKLCICERKQRVDIDVGLVG